MEIVLSVFPSKLWAIEVIYCFSRPVDYVIINTFSKNRNDLQHCNENAV